MRLRVVGVVLAVSFLVGCSTNPYVNDGAVGGASGAVLGAGTGAIIGSTISNGSVGKSAALGGAIGLPVGILAGVTYRAIKRERHLNRNEKAIKENYEYIVANQAEIDEARALTDIESHTIIPNRYRRAEIYTGPTIGVYE